MCGGTSLDAATSAAVDMTCSAENGLRTKRLADWPPAIFIRRMLRRHHPTVRSAGKTERNVKSFSLFESVSISPASGFVGSAQRGIYPRQQARFEAMSATAEEKKASAQRSRELKDDGRDQRLMSKSGVMEKKDQDAYAKIAIHACDSMWKKFNDCAKGLMRLLAFFALVPSLYPNSRLRSSVVVWFLCAWRFVSGKSISIPFLCSQEFNDANACTKA